MGKMGLRVSGSLVGGGCGPYRHHIGTTQAPYRDHRCIMQGQYRDHAGNIQGPLRHHTGTIQAPHKHHTETIHDIWKLKLNFEAGNRTRELETELGI